MRFFSDLLNSKLDSLIPISAADSPSGLSRYPVVNAALRPRVHAKAVGPDEFLGEHLKLGQRHDPTLLREIHRVIRIWREGNVPQQWLDAVIKFLYKISIG